MQAGHGHVSGSAFYLYLFTHRFPVVILISPALPTPQARLNGHRVNVNSRWKPPSGKPSLFPFTGHNDSLVSDSLCCLCATLKILLSMVEGLKLESMRIISQIMNGLEFFP